MKYLMFRYLFLFLIWMAISTISFVLISYFSGDWWTWDKYLILSLAQSAAFTLILLVIHLIRLKSLGVKSMAQAFMSSTHVADFDTRLSLPEISSLLDSNLGVRKLRNMNKEKMEFKKFFFTGYIKTTIKTKKSEEGKTTFTISSKPVWNSIVLDFGQSLLVNKRIIELCK